MHLYKYNSGYNSINSIITNIINTNIGFWLLNMHLKNYNYEYIRIKPSIYNGMLCVLL